MTHMSEENGHFDGGRWVVGAPEEEKTEGAPVAPEPPVDADTDTTQEIPVQEGPESAQGEPDPAVISQKIDEASASVAKAINDVIGLAHGVITTDDGHRYVEKTVKDAGTALQSGINDVLARMQETLKRKRQNSDEPDTNKPENDKPE
ncbi:hypothetical protein [Methanosphaerula palustris]|nr:hypothetical protein [Methanosphaerula palustris]